MAPSSGTLHHNHHHDLNDMDAIADELSHFLVERLEQ